MDARTRDAVAARDRSMARVSHMTWRIGSVAAAGAVVLGAGFAHLLPTHLPHFKAVGDDGSSGDNGSSNSNTGGGIQGPGTAPQQGSGSGSHVRSGGS